ncbi:SGNH/GDSL hydrolase family protein [Archangium lansingense]|uniref:SGNH/GDSL hydrolase family protein n=1 Tax=Archangium lansingense TaxID=2995310 RepID=UPI003B7AFC18
MFRPVRWFFVLLGCVTCTRTQQSSPPSSDTSRSVRVLFIGNSYTYYNDLPAMLEGFVRALAPGTRLETGSVLMGGATLESHWKGAEARALIRSGAWNYVVLQEQSLLGNLSINGVAHMNAPEERFFPYGRLFAQDVAAAGAQPVFYMTWSRKADMPAQEVLTYAYARLSREERGVLSPVGVAWQRVRRERPELELYVEDGHHPGPAGTYLAACVLYASLFHQPCLGAPSTLTGRPWMDTAFDTSRTAVMVSLPEDTARYLQQVGSEVGLAAELPESVASPPPAPVLPRLPRGIPLDVSRVAGTWEGTLAFYPAELGMAPVPFQLSLDTRGARPAGRVRILFPQQPPLEADVEPRVEGEVLSFSLPDATLLRTTLQLRAVLVEGELRGVASAEDPRGGRWFGSWSAHSAPGSQSTDSGR